MSEAVCRRWEIRTTDVSEAFLQGVTHEELAQITGEKLREVNFYLPANNIAILTRIPGYESFDPQREVLHCDKPGTGSVDAPRAFNIKLKAVLEKQIGMQNSLIDEQLMFCHKDDRLQGLMTVRVDDLKITGARPWVTQCLTCLEKVFWRIEAKLERLH